MSSIQQMLAAHEAAGSFIEVDGLRVFVSEKGDGETVLCIHGVPTSSFLYRKVIDGLAEKGMKGISFDLPGLGLSDRPQDFDYTWTGLAAFGVKVVDALKLEKFHLVVHDLGGPVGFEMAVNLKDRIQSLTVLDTLAEVHTFRKPWTMAPFAILILDRIWLGSINDFLFVQLMYLQGIKNKKAVSRDEILVHLRLLRKTDRGKAFLKIMKGFEHTKAKTALIAKAIQDVPYPIQIIWGKDDPAIPVKKQGEYIRKLAGLEEIKLVDAKHFLQEDQAEAIVTEIVGLAGADR
jgi:pimeloyl-ACP methyl ester carboxylesterase